MRTLTFHIGLHKTGTSYLQQALLANRALLAEAGLGLAPYLHPVEGNHYPMIAALREAGFARERFFAILDEVAALPDPQVLVTAEELCIAIMPHPERAEALRDAAARHFRPRIVVFLRRQDFLRESLYAQAVKTWHSGDIRAQNSHDRAGYYDHDARLRGLEAVFGRDNIRVALYRDGETNDLFGTLLAALDVAVDPARLRPVPRQNVTMHRRQALFMGQLPKSPRAQNHRHEMLFARKVSGILQASGAIADDGGRFLLSPAERRAFAARFTEGNRAVVERYAIADPGSFLDLPDPTEAWEPPRPITAEERRAAFRTVLKGLWSVRSPLRAVRATARAGVAFARMARSA
jgi:hypothetical protein